MRKATPGSYKPGQSGNLKGRPKKGHSITETIREMMDEQPEIKKALGQKILKMAMDGDITAMKTIWNYLDGMPQQNTDITTLGEKIGMILHSPEKNEK